LLGRRGDKIVIEKREGKSGTFCRSEVFVGEGEKKEARPSCVNDQKKALPLLIKGSKKKKKKTKKKKRKRKEGGGGRNDRTNRVADQPGRGGGKGKKKGRKINPCWARSRRASATRSSSRQGREKRRWKLFRLGIGEKK